MVMVSWLHCHGDIVISDGFMLTVMCAEVMGSW